MVAHTHRSRAYTPRAVRELIIDFVQLNMGGVAGLKIRKYVGPTGGGWRRGGEGEVGLSSGPRREQKSVGTNCIYRGWSHRVR